jgi:hypothetical protein
MGEIPAEALVDDEQVRTSSVEFVFSDHSLENLLRVAEAVLATDPDVVAVEKIREGSFGMGTAEEKRQLSERIYCGWCGYPTDSERIFSDR